MDVLDPATGSGPDDGKQCHQIGPVEEGDGPCTGDHDSSPHCIQAQVEKGTSVEKCILENSQGMRSAVGMVQSQPTGPSANTSHASSQLTAASSSNSSPSSYISFGSLIIHGPNKEASEGAGKNSDPGPPPNDNTTTSSPGTTISTSKGKTAAAAAAVDPSYADTVSGAPALPKTSPAPQPPAPAVASVPWTKDSVGPPPKVPIRFVDCVGRHYIIPWEKAKTWKEMKKLIHTAFVHIEGIGPRVLAGHYDLVIHDLWIDPVAVAIKTVLASYQPSEQYDALGTAMAASLGISLGSFGPASPSSSTTTTTTTAAAAAQSISMMSHILPKPCKGTVIMPELWEDLLQPGMTIKMLAWPPPPRRMVSLSPLRGATPQPPRAKTRKRPVG